MQPSDAEEEPIAIIRGVMMCLATCRSCAGRPQVSCERCGGDLQSLGIAAYRILRAELNAPRADADAAQ